MSVENESDPVPSKVINLSVQKSKSIGGDYMQTLTIIESIKNCFDVGIIFESLNNVRKRRFNMDMMEFLKQLFWGKGYDNIIPPQLSEKIKKSGDDILVIDLR